MRRARQRGLTLVEVLIAVALLAVTGILGYRALDELRRSADRLLETSEHWDHLELAAQRLARDLQVALPQPTAHRDGRLLPPLWARRADGHSAELVFVRQTPRAGVQRVGYRWLHTEQGGRLELLTYASPADDTPRRASPLLAGVAGFELAFLERAGGWQRDWPRRDGLELPRAVRVTLTLADGVTMEKIVDVPAAP